MSDDLAPIEVSCSYAPEDESFFQQLQKHLSLLTRQKGIILWHRRQITPGTDWTQAIDTQINRASVILLLISADFLASDYCYGVEMRRAMVRQSMNEAYVIPILMRPVDWQSAPFGKLQALPSNGKPISMWHNRDAAFADVTQGIRTALENVQHLVVSTPPTTFPRIWNIPYSRNPVFTGREEIINRIRTQLQTGQVTAISQPQAISGLGGIGKTQIAIEFAYQYYDDYQAVLWTLADTGESLVSGYVAIAALLNLPERNEQDQTKIVQSVIRWLSTSTKWLLILDNADNMTLVYEFLPVRFGGHLLLTTRAQATGTRAYCVEVEIMPQEIGALFLLRRAKRIPSDAKLTDAVATDVATAGEICEELGGLPLALDQAGAYIEETGCSVSGYLERYRLQHTLFLRRRGRTIPNHPESAMTTLSLNIEKVAKRKHIAVELLRFCTFLYPDSIPEELFTEGGTNLGPKLKALTNDPIKLDEVMETLRDYSLMRRDADAKTLSIHRLVQTVLKDQMSKIQQHRWIERVVKTVNDIFPQVEVATWPLCKRYLSQAQVCVDLIDQEGLTFPEAATLSHNAANYLREHARYIEAENFYMHASALREQVLGSDHPNTATTLDDMAVLYQLQGRYAEAEPLYLRALAIRERVLGGDHPDTATTLDNLAQTYQLQGRYVEAEPLYLRALAIRERVLGGDHPDTATTLNNLAQLYKAVGRYTEAEPLHLRDLAISERTLGPNHPDTATTLDNLATLYQFQGRYVEAEPLYQRALIIKKKAHEVDHPDTAITLDHLGMLYFLQGRYVEAESLYLQASIIFYNTLGPDHPDTAINLDSLALLHSAQVHYTEAEPLYQHALTIFEKTLGPDHYHTSNTLSNLAELYQHQGKYEQAEALYQRALTILEQHMGAEHPYTAHSLHGLAELYQHQGKYEQAEALYQRALAIREQRLGPTHPETQKTREAYTAFLRLVGCDAEATALDTNHEPLAEGH